MTTETMTEVTPELCFDNAAEALRKGWCEVAREWRQLGEIISTHAFRHGLRLYSRPVSTQ